MKAVIRRAGPEAASALAAAHGRCFAEGWSAASIAALLETPGSFALVARRENGGPGPAAEEAAEGFILCRVAADVCDLLTMGVLPQARGCGLGRALAEAALAEAGRCGASAMFLEVAAGNEAARRLYQSLGFRAVARRPDYYCGFEGAPTAAIVMTREIEPPDSAPR